MQEESDGIKNFLQKKDQMMKLMDRLLSSILSETNQISKGNSKFHCKNPPSIAISEYLKRIGKYSHCSNSVYILSLIYIDRLQQRIEGFVINSYSIHRLLISTIMVAAKFIDDFYYKNVYYAKIGGITLHEINSMQLEILKVFNFDMNVGDLQFQSYVDKLRNFQQINSI